MTRFVEVPKVCTHGVYGVPAAILESLGEYECAIVFLYCGQCSTAAIGALHSSAIAKLSFVGPFDELSMLWNEIPFDRQSVDIQLVYDYDLRYIYNKADYREFDAWVDLYMETHNLIQQDIGNMKGWKQIHGDIVRH